MENLQILHKKRKPAQHQPGLFDIPEYHALIHNKLDSQNHHMTIEFYVIRQNRVELQISNQQGEVIATLISAPLSAGKYKINWDPDNLPDGEYVLNLNIGKFKETRKFMLFK
jgi:hypothetical protein